MTEIFSIGHSTLDIGSFLSELKSHNINAIADVRSSPYSKNFPQFNREELKATLDAQGIAYVFLGAALGGRPKDQLLYTNGVADYEKMAAAESFKENIDRLEDGAKKYRLALLCSERSPFDCHRCLLVGRAIWERGILIDHIIPGAHDITQQQVESQLLVNSNKAEDDMFATPQDRLNDAYRDRSRRVAYSESGNERPTNAAAE